jgi:hypothetical protein
MDTLAEYSLGFSIPMPKYLFSDDQENYPNVTVSEHDFMDVVFNVLPGETKAAIKATYYRSRKKLIEHGFIGVKSKFLYKIKSHK